MSEEARSSLDAEVCEALSKIKKAPIQLSNSWIHESFDPVTHLCKYCGAMIRSASSTVKRKHLLNPRTCRWGTVGMKVKFHGNADAVQWA
jgi:hypothetical protein